MIYIFRAVLIVDRIPLDLGNVGDFVIGKVVLLKYILVFQDKYEFSSKPVCDFCLVFTFFTTGTSIKLYGHESTLF